MSSGSGDEAKIELAEPVRRTRSGRAGKTAVVAKKSSVKKLSARATRFSRNVYEIEEVEEETTSTLKEGMMESMPEDGVQRLADVSVEQRSEEDTPTLHLELEDSKDANIQEMNMGQEINMDEEINMGQDEEMEQDVEDMRHSNIRSEGMAEDNSMDKVEMLAEREDIEIEGQDVSSDDSNQQRVFNEDDSITKRIPIGVDNFKKLVKGDYLFCDKTAMIAELLSKDHTVILITRPRRWGKTLNMSMLHHFFASEVNGISTEGLFNDLAIGKLDGGKYLEHQGKHPVIMISFKDINSNCFEGAYRAVYQLIRTLIGSYAYLLESDKITNKVQITDLSNIINEEANQQKLESSLQLLSHCLYKHHGQGVYIIIDEYDTPINKALELKKTRVNEAYFEAIVQFMRNLFSSALKGNPALEKGILTGILRVSKDSMLSGLNNLVPYTLLDEGYSSYFGFSQEEVEDLLKKKKVFNKLDEVKSWYNGYKIGDINMMYNPWSIMEFFNRNGQCDLYWIHTNSNEIIKRHIFSSKGSIKAKFEKLLQRESVSVSINKHISFDFINKDERAFWGLLLFSGYLTWKTCSLGDGCSYNCELRIPNNEVYRLYTGFFMERLESKFKSLSKFDVFVNYLLDSKVNEFTKEFNNLIKNCVSYLDAGKGETFYHALTIGILFSVIDRYHVRSNAESGYGRYDVVVIPKEYAKALVLEFKYVLKEKNQISLMRKKKMEKAARLALDQIQENEYRTELLQHSHLQEILEVGIAFSGKLVVAAYATYDLHNHQAGTVTLTNT